jgi:hypothetical protein
MDDAIVVKEEHVSVKTEDCPTVLGAPRMMKGESSKKATNKSLPEGAHPFYRRFVVPMIIHWAAGNVPDPFNINEDDMVKALATIWKQVYADEVMFDIPPIVSVVRMVCPFLELLTTGLIDQSTLF